MTDHEPDPLKDSFPAVLRLVWAHVLSLEPTELQRDIAQYLQEGPNRRMVQAFRGVGKSWLTAAYVVWRLHCDPDAKILVVSASKQLADNFTTFVLQIINLIPEFQYLRPTTSQREAKVQFDVGPARPAKDPSVRSAGITGQITGSRATEIIADDVEIPNNSQTQLMREKLSESIKEFDSIILPGGRITFLGTPQCAQSIYRKLVDERGYDCRIWPAKYPTAEVNRRIYRGRLGPGLQWRLERNPRLAGRSTEPTRFSDEDLEARRGSIGSSTFALQFLLDTSASDANKYPLKLADLIVYSLDHSVGPQDLVWASGMDQLLKTEFNVGLDGDFFYSPLWVDKESKPLPYEGAVLAIDPSGRGKDETGFAVVKVLHGRLFLVAWGGLKGGYTDSNLERLAKLARDQNVSMVLVEANFGDGMWTKLLHPHLQRIHPACSVEEVKHYGVSKERRIIDTLEPVLNQHRLVVDSRLIEADYRSVEGYDEGNSQAYRGFYQLTHLSADKGSLVHDDRLDALAIAVAYWIEHMALSTRDAKAQAAADALTKELEEFHSWVYTPRASEAHQSSRERDWNCLRP